MKKRFYSGLFLVLIVLLIISSQKVVSQTSGIAMSPSCYYVNDKGECYTKTIERGIYEYTFRVYNYDNDTKEIEISYYAPIDVIVNIEEPFIELGQHNGKTCDDSPGCKEFSVLIDTSNSKRELKTINIYAKTSATEEGMMIINQILNAKITFKLVSEKPENLVLGLIVMITLNLIMLFLVIKEFIRKLRGEETIYGFEE